MNKISSLTICQDEESFIGHMLDWLIMVAKPDEIVIIDGGSIDKTIEIINSYKDKANIKLFENPMPDSFSEQRNFALQQCTGDWILQIDADETYSKSIADLLVKIKLGFYEDTDGFIMPTAHLIKDEYHMNDNGGDVHVRLFKKLLGVSYKGAIHEELYYGNKTLREEGTIIPVNVALRHYSKLKNNDDLILKSKRYFKCVKLSQEAGIPITEDEEFFVKAIENRIAEGDLISVPKEWE